MPANLLLKVLPFSEYRIRNRRATACYGYQDCRRLTRSEPFNSNLYLFLVYLRRRHSRSECSINTKHTLSSHPTILALAQAGKTISISMDTRLVRYLQWWSSEVSKTCSIQLQLVKSKISASHSYMLPARFLHTLLYIPPYAQGGLCLKGQV